MNNFNPSLYLVTDSGLSKGRSHEDIIKKAVEGGVTMVQLREKNISTLEFYQLAISLKKLLHTFKIPLIINDRLDIALAIDADGLHIGQSDLPYEIARKLLGKEKIIGLSVETIQQAKEANFLNVDYIGLSPVFSTNTKEDTGTPLGISGIKKITSFTKHKTVAIGGINTGNAGDVITSGADGIAVVSAIVSHKDPQQAAAEFTSIINQARQLK
jgi:thiamine-phosphate pyrophosphorylase